MGSCLCAQCRCSDRWCSSPPSSSARRAAAPHRGQAPAAGPAPPPLAVSKPSVAPEPGDPEWHYEGPEGPERWGKLSPEF